MRHLLHAGLPAGSVLEIAPENIELGLVEADEPTYCFDFKADGITVRVTLPEADFRTLIEGAAAKLAETPGASNGNGKPSPIQIARALPTPRPA